MATRQELERLAVVETEIKNLKESNATEHQGLGAKVDCLDQKMDKFIEAANKTYAPKAETEKRIKALWGVIGTMIMALATYLIWVAQSFVAHISK